MLTFTPKQYIRNIHNYYASQLMCNEEVCIIFTHFNNQVISEILESMHMIIIIIAVNIIIIIIPLGQSYEFPKLNSICDSFQNSSKCFTI